MLGGGLVPGSVVLLAGAPGIGKSTLLLQLASSLTAAGHPCLLASGEEARGQVTARARRLGLKVDGLGYVPGRDLSQVVATILAERPVLAIVDSVQTIRNPESDALPGGVAQVRACADALVSLAKEHGTTVLLVGHVTKEGDLAGPRTLEHTVDAVLTFEGDHRSGLRVLAGGKNRFGPEGEVAWFEMTSAGLVETETGPLIGEGRAEAGCATALALAGPSMVRPGGTCRASTPGGSRSWRPSRIERCGAAWAARSCTARRPGGFAWTTWEPIWRWRRPSLRRAPASHRRPVRPSSERCR